MDKRHFLQALAGAPLLVARPASAQLRDYPSRPIRLVSPFAAGSTSDTSARFIGFHLASGLGQPVSIDNQPGADGRIGMMAAKNAPADGYTLVLGSWTNLAVNAVLIKGLPYDPLKDFKPVAGIGRSMLGIAVPGASPLKTLTDLVDAARKNPRGLNFGNFATGYRLAIEWFSSLAGVQFTHVPYKTTSQMNTDLAGGQIQVAMDGVTSMAALVKAGQLRLLAVTGEQRHAEFAEVPTIRESYPEYAIYGWSALMVRAEVADDITQRLADVVNKVLAAPEGRDFARKVGSELLLRGPADMRRYQVSQIETLRRVAEAAGMKPE